MARHQRNVALVESERDETDAAPPVSLPNEIQDVPLDTIENAPGYVFIPSAGIGALDLKEIILSYLLSLTSNSVVLEKGALRSMPLPANRYEDLSDMARRHMHSLAPKKDATE